ncbi:chemotaxis protein CheW [Bowmanella dokdonensis]|uniref:Chemotaxis protein CheW n=1 Tax=Bowmanella dokdonensis TaxID=751969 RepID=A0A939DR83_9ALTE|nr:chemotaxis protein CheW [Bowmanella dokdonensis]MBN7826461.1 chemotaxis protein CheW [Bowmanella dokdonensis]
MSKGQFANEKVMEDYLSALLTDDPVVDPIQRDSVARLLEKAREDVAQIQEATSEVPPPAPERQKTLPEEPEYRRGRFQALYFRVAGLVLAVPLTELGGIHKMDKTSPLIGGPDWFSGVMLHRDEKLKVVDTAQWVMPEKYNETLAESLNYQYLIMLENSGWGLCCESLINTVTLEQDDVKWRESHGKRPWLAGLVKEKMCALINVKEMVTLLNQGLGSREDDEA